MTTAAVRFPRSMKRGPKVRKGPCAIILAFPSQLTGEALRAKWSWLKDHAWRWEQESCEGTYTDPKDWDRAVCFASQLIPHFEGVEFNESYMRQEVRKGCERVEKRVCVKDWLDGLGIDWATHKTPEDALFFLHDKLCSSGIPGAA